MSVDASLDRAVARPARQARRAGSRRLVPPAIAWLALPAAFLAAFFVLPMVLMLIASLGAKGFEGLTLQNYREFLDRPVLWGALVNSMELTALTVVLSLPLAYGLAAAIAWTVPERWQSFVLALVILPFFASYVVRTYAWLLVLSDRGIVNQVLLAVGVIQEPLRLVSNRTGVLIVFVHYFTMIMAMAIYVNLRRIPMNIIKAARDLGAPWRRVFVEVILPLSLPGVAVGVFLTVVIAIGDYVTPQVLGGGQELTLPQAIMLQIGRFANQPLAAALSFILTLVVIAFVIGFSPWLRQRRPA